MIRLEDLKGLVEQLGTKYPTQFAYLALSIPEGPGPEDVEAFCKEIREMGYAVMVRTTEFGDEMVITDKVEHGNSGPPWR